MHARCNVTGKHIIIEKKAAKDAAKVQRSHFGGRAKAIWCVFCGHYHLTKGQRGNKGKGDLRR